MIPGKGLGGALIRNTVAEGIESAERYLQGKHNNLSDSVKRVAVGTLIDGGVEKGTGYVAKKIEVSVPKYYAPYAKKQRQKNLKITRHQVKKKIKRSIRWGKRLANCFNFIAGSVRNAMPW